MQFIEIWGPDRQPETIKLDGTKKRLTIGRRDDNDIILIPDPQKNISRVHCILEQAEDGYWYVLDHGSSNGTFLLRHQDKIDVQREKRVRIKNEDVILILAVLPSQGDPIFWSLTFRDLDITNQPPVPISQVPSDSLEYSFAQKMLFARCGENRKEIPLTSHERKMIHYMALQNQGKNAVAVLCAYDDLISAIWDDAFGHNKDNVIRLVWQLRQKIEQDSGNPKFLKTVPGDGYCLEVGLLE